MQRRALSVLMLCGLLTTGPVLSGDTVTAARAFQSAAEEDTRTLFLRCCWALGRAGFHFCGQYGVCASDPQATCTGIGAAEGMTASCAAKPPDLPDEGG
jgi:hypothetical protein